MPKITIVRAIYILDVQILTIEEEYALVRSCINVASLVITRLTAYCAYSQNGLGPDPVHTKSTETLADKAKRPTRGEHD